MQQQESSFNVVLTLALVVALSVGAVWLYRELAASDDRDASAVLKIGVGGSGSSN